MKTVLPKMSDVKHNVLIQREITALGAQNVFLKFDVYK